MPVHPSVTVVWAALRCAGRPTFPSRVVWRVRTLSDPVRVKVFCAAIHPEEMADALAKKAQGRQKFQHEGRTVYEWEQTLDEVLIYITPPPGITAAQLDCKKGDCDSGEALHVGGGRCGQAVVKFFGFGRTRATTRPKARREHEHQHHDPATR